MSNVVPWAALAVSSFSALFSGAVYWTHRERLKLDLYRLRFGVYSRASDLCQALQEWSPTKGPERLLATYQESPRFSNAMNELSNKATAEAQFLFEDKAIKELLEKIEKDASTINQWMRKIRPRQTDDEKAIGDKAIDESWERIVESMLLLKDKMGQYLTYKAPFFGPR
jgi:hypothetical protein